MRPEEAGELVLKGWQPCARCGGLGYRHTHTNTMKVGCKKCSMGGYVLSDMARWAFSYLDIPIPPKPLTMQEQIAKETVKILGDKLKEHLAQPSLTRQIMPPIKAEKL